MLIGAQWVFLGVLVAISCQGLQVRPLPTGSMRPLQPSASLLPRAGPTLYARSSGDPLRQMCPSPYSSKLKQPISVSSLNRYNPPPGVRTSSFLRQWVTRDNIKTNYYDNMYYNSYGFPTVFGTRTVVERINPSIPEPYELAASPVATPYYGPVNNPNTFSNWEGLNEAIFRELNLARTRPDLYANFVQASLNSFVDDGTFLQDGRLMRVNEGRRAWLEAINFLRRQRPVKPLRRIRCLDCSASYMAADSSRYRIIGHSDSTGRNSFNRTQIACLHTAGGENIAYGTNSARSIVLSLIIDDGVADRGHRDNIYQNFTQVGIGSGKYGGMYSIISVQDFLY